MRRTVVIVLIGVIILAVCSALFFINASWKNKDSESNENTVTNTETTDNSNAYSGIYSTTNENIFPSNENNTDNVNNSNNYNNVNESVENTQVPDPTVSDTKRNPLNDTILFEKAEAFVVDLMTGNKSGSGSSIASDIPSQYKTDNNALNRIKSGEDPFESMSRFEHFSNPVITKHYFLHGSDSDYSRHMLTVDMTSLGGRLPDGSELPAGRIVTRQVDLVIDRSDSSIVFLSSSTITPLHVPLVENEYELVAENFDSYGIDTAKKAKAIALLFYSYTPFVEDRYWDIIANNFELGSSSFGAIITDLKRSWRPTSDGSGLRVISLSDPEEDFSYTKDKAYKCQIAYKTDHQGTASETVTIETLEIVLDMNTGKVKGMDASNVQSFTVEANANTGSPDRPLSWFMQDGTVG